MASRTVRISHTSICPYDSAAALIALLAYPSDQDINVRMRLQNLLAKWAIESRCEHDPSWSEEFDLIRPALVSTKPNEVARRRGLKIVSERMLVCTTIIQPILDKQRGHKVSRRLPPTAENMMRVAAAYMSWSENSVPTIKSKIWKPAWPVAHILFALTAMTMTKIASDIFTDAPSIRPATDALGLLQFFPDSWDDLVKLSESFRIEMSQVHSFRMKRDEAIKLEVEHRHVDLKVGSWSHVVVEQAKRSEK